MKTPKSKKSVVRKSARARAAGGAELLAATGFVALVSESAQADESKKPRLNPAESGAVEKPEEVLAAGDVEAAKEGVEKSELASAEGSAGEGKPAAQDDSSAAHHGKLEFSSEGGAGSAGEKVAAAGDAAEVDPEALVEAEPSAFGPAAAAPFLGLGAGGAAAAGAGVVGVAAAAGGGGGGGGGGAASGPVAVATPSATSHSGTVIDGPVKGAKIFYDANANGVQDAGEVSAITDASGKFTLNYTSVAGGKLVSVGGKDIYTGKDVGLLVAPDGATVVTPLTALIAGGIDQNALKAALGIPAGVDLTKYDPFAVLNDPAASAKQIADAQSVAEVSQKLFVVMSAATALGGGDVAALNTAIAAIDQAIASLPAGAPIADVVNDVAVAAVAAVQGENITQLLADIHAGVAIDAGNYVADAAAVKIVDAVVVASDAIDFSTLNTALDAYTAGNVSAMDVINQQVGAAQDIGQTVASIDAGTFASVVDLTDSEAASLVLSGTHFSAADQVTVHAAGTVLNTSVADMQALGVDSVAGAPGVGALDVVLGGANLGAALPSFAGALDVTLGVADNQVADVFTANHASALLTAGVDHIHALDGSLTVNAAGFSVAKAVGLSFAQGDEVTLSATGAELKAAGIVPHDAALMSIDVVDLTDNLGNISVTEAADLIAGGVHFAANDVVTVHASGTVLDTSVAALQTLGIDSIAGETPTAAVHAALGDVNFNVPLPVFDSGLNVTVGIDDAQVSNVLTDAHALALAASGVDHIGANDHSMTVTFGEFSAASAAGLDFAPADEITISAWASDIGPGTPLHNMNVDVIDLLDPAWTINDTLAQEAIGAGLHFAANDTISVHAEGTVLHSSLHDMQTLGVDAVIGSAKDEAGQPNTNNMLHVTVGDGFSIHDVASAALPTFESGVAGVATTTTDINVELWISDAQKAGTTIADIAALETSGIDQITTVDNTATPTKMLDTEQLSGNITETQTAFEVSDELAKILVDAGLISGTQDTGAKSLVINVNDTNGDSALSFLMMGDLGVDQVTSTSADVMVSLGFHPGATTDATLDDLVTALANLGNGTHAVFVPAENVTLDVASLDATTITADELTKLKLLGVDNIQSSGHATISTNVPV